MTRPDSAWWHLYLAWWRKAIKHTDAVRVKPPDRGLARQRPRD